MVRQKSGTCTECGKGPRNLAQRHPQTRNPICSSCRLKVKGRFGLCPECKNGPKWLAYLHPNRERHVCRTCHKRLTRDLDICPRCGQGPKVLFCFDGESKKYICRGCYRRQKRKECFLGLPLKEAIRLVLEVAESVNQRESGWNGRLDRLYMLTEAAPERIIDIRNGIYNSFCSKALDAFRSFERTEEGKKIQQLINQKLTGN